MALNMTQNGSMRELEVNIFKTNALKSSGQEKFLLQNPKSQLITKTDLSKVRNSWSGFPHIVSRGAQTNFTDFADKMTKVWSNEKIHYSQEINIFKKRSH
ncbi:hypothetical protein DMH27_17590 [Raoultella planticola]|nr:hypothetical protein [Raoultella planticola]